MANKKISEMTYKQLAADDMIPSVNPTTDPTENYNFLGADIPLLVGISVWDVSATYSAGHTVIYNGTTVKGIFLVTSATSAGDSPEGAAYAKFKSLGLGFIPNAFDPADNVGYCRTGRIRISGTFSGSPGTTLYNISTNFAEADIQSAKITASVSFNGQFALAQVRSMTASGTPGDIAFYIETWGSWTNTFYVDYMIEM